MGLLILRIMHKIKTKALYICHIDNMNISYSDPLGNGA